MCGQHRCTAAARCSDGVPDASFAPLRRLTRVEYNNTVRDLLGDDSRPADAFVADEIVGGFDANAVGHIDKKQMEDYFQTSEAIAKDTVQNRVATITTCDLSDAACVHDDLRSLARRAFRRPIDGDIEGELTSLYDDALTTWDAATALELVVTSQAAPAARSTVDASSMQAVARQRTYSSTCAT